MLRDRFLSAPWMQFPLAPPTDDGNASFSADDLNLLADADAGEADGEDKGDGGTGDKSAADADKSATKADAPADKGDKTAKPLAAGEEPKKEEPAKPYWPENWREKAAEHIAAGDKKIYDKELRRLQRIADPASVYGLYREAEGRLTSGGLVKLPGKDAKPEDIEAFHKALGVPEKPEDYVKDMTFENGAVFGDADKPMLDGVLAVMHKAGATPPVVQSVLNWYLGEQERAATELDLADDEFKHTSLQSLKQEWGPAAFERERKTAMRAFKEAEGGHDWERIKSNPDAVANVILSARGPDNKILGNDPRVLKWLNAISRAAYPEESVVEDGAQGGKTLSDELAEIQKLRTTDNKRYWSDAVQKRELELINAQQKAQARA